MINRVIRISALVCFALAFLLFLSRLFNIVTPYSKAYTPVVWTFFWAFALAVILGDIFLLQEAYSSIQARTPVLRLVYSMSAFFLLLICGAIILLMLALAMNFMGQ